MEHAGDAQAHREHPDDAIARLAESQFGAFSRSQAGGLGLTKGMIEHRLRAGRWERLSRDVFRLKGAPRSWHQDLAAAYLSWEPHSVVSHTASAALRQIAGFEPHAIELTVPAGLKRKGLGVVHRNALPSADVTTLGPFRVTTVSRTLLDLAAVAPLDSVEAALDDALRRRLVSIARLRWQLGSRPRHGRSGVASLRTLVEARDPRDAVPQSVLETKLLRLIARAGIRTLVRQHPVRRGSRVVAILDFALPNTSSRSRPTGIAGIRRAHLGPMTAHGGMSLRAWAGECFVSPGIKSSTTRTRSSRRCKEHFPASDSR